MYHPSSPRSTPHSVMAQQGYFYYPQQASHQYPASDFNCNFVAPSQMTDGFQTSWYNPSMYMTQAHSSTAVYPQRAHNGYEDWGLASPIHPGLPSTGAHSPLQPLPPSSSTSSSTSTHHSSLSVQPPLSPSPCGGLSNGTPAGQGSPSYYAPYGKGPSEYGEAEGPHSTPERADANLVEMPLDPHKSPPHVMRPQQARSPYEWMKKSYQAANGNSAEDTYVDIDNMAVKSSQEEEAEMRESTWKVAGKTRTKDKYRVVYSDHQRLELEKEFHYSRYITIRRKSELATMLVLSERQVKIWFQNRRAKERKQLKKREDIGKKDQMDVAAVAAAAGVAFHHPPSIHQLAHHPQAPPHHPHLAPIHPHPHPHSHPQAQPQPQPLAHEYHHLNPHCLTPKLSPLMLPDVKPNLNMD